MWTNRDGTKGLNSMAETLWTTPRLAICALENFCWEFGLNVYIKQTISPFLKCPSFKGISLLLNHLEKESSHAMLHYY